MADKSAFYIILPGFLCSLLRFLLKHPADKQDTDDNDIDDISRDPHDQPAQLLVGCRRESPDARGMDVRSIERLGKGEPGAKRHDGNATEAEIEHLATKRQARQVPGQRAKVTP